MKNILFINHSIRDGGPGRSLYYLLKHFDYENFNVNVLIPDKKVFSDRIEKDNLNINQIVNSNIVSIGITNQRETTVLWNKKSGKPVSRAIVWQDRRTSSYCKKLKEKGLEKTIQNITGLVIDPYFSATKIKWIIDNNQTAK